MSGADALSAVEALLEAGEAELAVERLRSCIDEAAVGAFGDRWFTGPTSGLPHVRRALLSYVDRGCDVAHHRALVKRTFKAAEREGDDELMGHFLVAFDRFAHRRIAVQARWNSAQHRQVRTLALTLSRDVPAFSGTGPGAVFSRHTREYLKRRAFRYFRVMALRDPARFRRAMVLALPLYRDEDLRDAAQLLDAWSLCHLLFGRSEVLVRKPGGIRIAEGHTLPELAPAPMCEDVWGDGFDELLTVFERARSRVVRSWAIAMLRRHHAEALVGLPLARVVPLLRSPVEEVQAFGVELLGGARDLEETPLDLWLELLRLQSHVVLPRVCELVSRVVSAEQLTLAQCIELACSPAAPAAELGLRWVLSKPIATAELPLLARLTETRVPRLRDEAASFVVRTYASNPEATPEMVREVLDSRFLEVRAAGVRLMLTEPRFRDQTALWLAMAESPWPDIREELSRHLDQRARQLGPDTVRQVWASVLLGVTRGGRAKRRVVDQLAERIVAAPASAGSLLPLLSVALRSVRAPERRAALAALARAAFAEPRLRTALGAALPELRLFPEERA